jgi:selenocysteine lyase/cysteine desulfurase
MPERFESGTLNTAGIAGLRSGVDYIRAVGVDAIGRKEAALVSLLLEGLSDIKAVTCHGPAAGEPRGGLASFTVAGIDPQEISFRLDREYDISVRVGLHCAPSAHRSIGTYPGGTIRVSPGWFTTERDVDFFLTALREIVGKG